MTFFPNGRGDLGRTPAFMQTDFFAEQQARLRGTALVSFGVNLINLFDQDTATSFFVNPYRDNVNLPDAQSFGGFDPEAVVTLTPVASRRTVPLGQWLSEAPVNSAAGAV